VKFFISPAPAELEKKESSGHVFNRMKTIFRIHSWGVYIENQEQLVSKQ